MIDLVIAVYALIYVVLTSFFTYKYFNLRSEFYRMEGIEKAKKFLVEVMDRIDEKVQVATEIKLDFLESFMEEKDKMIRIFNILENQKKEIASKNAQIFKQKKRIENLKKKLEDCKNGTLYR